MKKWDRELQAKVRNFVRQFAWQLPVYDADDLVQEAWGVYARVVKRYTFENIAEYIGTTDRAACERRWYTLLYASIRKRMATLRQQESVRRSVPLEFECGRRDWSFEAVDLRLGLERSPRVRRVLRESSWEDNKARVRTPRARRDGTLETTGDVLYRLARRRSLPQESEGAAIRAELAALV